jgi:hypothetical protein
MGCAPFIVETANRFARDLMVQEVGFAMLRDLGVTLIAADSPSSFLDDGPTSKLIRQILGAVSEFEAVLPSHPAIAADHLGTFDSLPEFKNLAFFLSLYFVLKFIEPATQLRNPPHSFHNSRAHIVPRDRVRVLCVILDHFLDHLLVAAFVCQVNLRHQLGAPLALALGRGQVGVQLLHCAPVRFFETGFDRWRGVGTCFEQTSFFSGSFCLLRGGMGLFFCRGIIRPLSHP